MIIDVAHRIEHVEEYYFSKKLAEIAALNAKGCDIINLGIGSPDMAPDSSVISALHETAMVESSHGYQSYRGIYALREAFSNFYKSTYKVALNPDTEILPLIGSKEGIVHISLAFLNNGDKVLVPDPGYLAYSAAAKIAGAEVQKYNLKEGSWEPDWEALEKMDWAKIKLWWLNYPNMPTGATASVKIFEKIKDLALRKKVLVVNDNPYSLVLNKEAPKSLLSVVGGKDFALELNSLSKSHNMAGWRIGMLGGSARYIDAVLRVKSNFDSGMFKAVQIAAARALSLSESWHEERNSRYMERRKKVYDLLDLLGCKYSKKQEGLFVWAKVPDLVDSVELWTDKILHSAGVFITPGFIFGDQGRRYIRISLCSSLERLNESILRIKNKLA